MGQYYKIVNLDKMEYLDPFEFGEGLKLMEFGLCGVGSLAGLAVLLATSNGIGGGDLHIEDDRWEDIPGRWVGDRVVIAGDYDEQEHSLGKDVYQRISAAEYPTPMSDLVDKIEGNKVWRNISADVIGALMEDSYAEEQLSQMIARQGRWAKEQAQELWNHVRPGQPFPVVKS